MVIHFLLQKNYGVKFLLATSVFNGCHIMYKTMQSFRSNIWVLINKLERGLTFELHLFYI